MSNYKKMFDEINISDDCLRKVRNMEAKNNKIKNFRLRYAAVALVLIALFATSNVVSYAATGSSITKNIQVMLTDENGKKTELKETEKGKYIYKSNDEEMEVNVNKDTIEDESMDVNVNMDKNKNEVNLEINSLEK